MPQTAAGTRMDAPVSVPTEASPMPVATAAAEPPLEPPGDARRVVRIAHGTVRRVLAGGAERELVQVGAADDDRAGLVQPAHHRRIVWRDAVVEDVRCRSGDDARLVDDVLDRDGNAVERTAVDAAGAFAIGRVGRRARTRGVHRDEGAESVVLVVDGVADCSSTSDTGRDSRPRAVARPPRRWSLAATTCRGRRGGRRCRRAPASAARAGAATARAAAASASSVASFIARPTPCGPGSKMCSSAGTPALRSAR